MTQIPKTKPYRNQGYLNFIRAKPCLICSQKAEAHHVRRSYWQAGTSQKPHDYVSIPLCYEHHNPIIEHQTNCERAIIELLMEYIESKRGKKSRVSKCNSEWYAGEWCKECHAKCGLEGGKK